MFCEKCGSKIGIDAAFCGSCGAQLSNVEQVSQVEVQTKGHYENNQRSYDSEKKGDVVAYIVINSILAIIGLFFAGIICYGIGFFLASMMKKNGAKGAFTAFIIINSIGMFLSLITFFMILGA